MKRITRTSACRLLAILALTLPAGLAATAQQADKDRAFAVVPQVGPLKGKQVYASSYALIVGINAYPNVPRKWWLSRAVDDARSVRDLLVRSYGFPAENITLLTDGDATEKKIRSALASFTSFTRIKQDDRILVYFSGHGQTVKLPGSSAEMGFLVPYDAEVDLNDFGNPEPYLKTCIPMRQVWEYLDASPAKHALVVADACYSGLLAKTRAFLNEDEKIPDAQLQALAKERTRQVITAGKKGETAVELQALGHGAFTHTFLDLLKKGAVIPGEVFTSNQLYNKLFPAVGRITDGRQSPQLSNYGDTEGQFLFISTPEVELNNGPVAEDSISRLFVRTDPPGATIFVDGREFREGKTPFTVPVGLGGDKVRSVEITVELNGERKTSKVALVAGRFTQLPLLQFAGGGRENPDPGSPFKAGQVRVNEKDGAETVWIPGGEFMMGADRSQIDAAWKRYGWPDDWKRWTVGESPTHRVRVSGFWLYRATVTVAQFRRFCSATGRAMPEQPGWNVDDHPVVNVTWAEAKAYCDWAEARLPTGAEWERAARGTYSGLEGRPLRTFLWGDALPTGNQPIGNLADESLKANYPYFTGYRDGFPQTSPAASFPPSEWNVYDLSGNVEQWCADWYAQDYYRNSPLLDPQGPASGSTRVVRGVSWANYPSAARISRCDGYGPEGRYYNVGFRPARSQ